MKVLKRIFTDDGCYLLRLWIYIALMWVAIWCTGCKFEEKLYQRRVEQIPAAVVGSVTEWSTNEVVYPAQTNLVTGVVAPPVTNVIILPHVRPVYAPPVTTTNLVPNPVVESVIASAGALPIPWAGTAAAVVGWLYTAYANFRNKKLSKALVEGIEAGRKILTATPEGQKVDQKVKDALMDAQMIRGVLNEASKLVNELTDKTVPRG